MALPEDAIKPFTDCMGGLEFPDLVGPILGPGGLGNFALAQFSVVLAGAQIPLDFLPLDPENLPSIPPDLSLFIAPFFASFNIPGDFGGMDFSICLPGGPTIPPEGPNVIGDQTGLSKLICMAVTGPFLVITFILQSIIDLSPALPSLSIIIDILVDLAFSMGLSGLSITAFIGCFAQGILDIITAVIPI